MLEPDQCLTYLGMEFCPLPAPHLRVPKDKLQRAKESVRGILRRVRPSGGAAADGGSDRRVTLKGCTLLKVLGLFQSFGHAIPLG